MSVWQTLLVYVVIPAALYGVIALLSSGSRAKRGPRYRTGQAWSYPAVWWSANPDGLVAQSAPRAENSVTATPTVKGGARGNW